jgi:CheY-like chemotaxis protein
LRKRGYAVSAVENGKEAIMALDRESFDLVLMDVQMPVMNGFETTTVLRDRERSTGTRLPIIAVTAHALEGDRERCLAADMDAYISKPIKAQELFDAIERVTMPANLSSTYGLIGSGPATKSL